MVLRVQYALEQFVVEVGDGMDKLSSQFSSLDGVEALPGVLQHLAVQTVLGQGGQHLRPVVAFSFVGCLHPLASTHHLQGAVRLSLKVQAQVDGSQGHRAGGRRGGEERREGGRRLRQPDVVNAKSVQMMQDDVTALPLLVTLTQAQQRYAQLRHQPAVAMEEGVPEGWVPCGVGGVPITKSTLPTLAQVGEEDGEGIGLSQFGIVGDCFPNREHQQFGVLSGSRGIHVH